MDCTLYEVNSISFKTKIKKLMSWVLDRHHVAYNIKYMHSTPAVVFLFFSERVKSHFESSMSGEVKRPKSESEISYLWSFIDLLSNINETAESVGKDGKFQIFICVGVR